jgi:polyphosphate kinase 2 (PPK2 family)
MAKAQPDGRGSDKLTRKRFERELLKLQRELVIMQEYVRAKGLKIVVTFEGRDAAGKGGVIKRIADRTNTSRWRPGGWCRPTTSAGPG